MEVYIGRGVVSVYHTAVSIWLLWSGFIQERALDGLMTLMTLMTWDDDII